MHFICAMPYLEWCFGCSNSEHPPKYSSHFITRQHTVACRVRYYLTISVRPSVRHVVVLYLDECIYCQTFSIAFLSLSRIAVTKFQKEPASTCAGKICEFRQKLRFVSETVRDRTMLSLVRITNMKSA